MTLITSLDDERLVYYSPEAGNTLEASVGLLADSLRAALEREGRERTNVDILVESCNVISKQRDAALSREAALMVKLNDTETQGRLMHESWTRTKRGQGFHLTKDNHYPALGIERCAKCHDDLVPWEQLPEKQKDINRHAFDAIRDHFLGKEAPK